MEIHKLEKIWIGLSILLIVGFISTVTYGALGYGVKMIGDAGTIETPSQPTKSPNFKKPGVYKNGDNGLSVYMVARQFFFKPGSFEDLVIPANRRIEFHVTAGDVIHGFNVVGTNINTMVIPGQITRFTVRFDRPGEYGIVCHEYCGVGHHTMDGTIKVVNADDYDINKESK